MILFADEPGTGTGSGPESRPGVCMLCGGPATWRMDDDRGVLVTCAPCGLLDADADECSELLERRQRADTLADGAAGERELATLATLPANPPAAELERALRALGHALTGTDALRVGIAREAAIAALKGKVSGPAGLVDATLAALRHENGDGASALGFVDPEPWPEPVDGAELLEDLGSVFSRYLELPEGAARALALWTLHAWALEAFSISPRLGVLSPTKQCGKTTLLDVLGLLTPRPLPAVNVTEATIFRVVDAWSPTLLIDEADRHLDERKRPELVGILNAGHRRGAVVPRCVGDLHEVRPFKVFSALALAAIGRLPDTLEDRGVIVTMRRKSPDSKVESLRLDRATWAEPIRQRCRRWTEDSLEVLRAADPTMPAGFYNRKADNWGVLFAIADVAGGSWPKAARDAAETLAGAASSDEGKRELLLSDIRDVFDETKAESIATERLLELLARREDRPWGEWSNGKRMTGHALGRQLKPFGVKSGRVVDRRRERPRLQPGRFRGVVGALPSGSGCPGSG